MNNKQHPDDMRAQGYEIDDTCYPWVAYIGPRHNPAKYHWCYTDLESKMMRHFGISGVQSGRMQCETPNLTAMPTKSKPISCSRCGAAVSSPVPSDTIVRAFIECPECLEKA